MNIKDTQRILPTLVKKGLVANLIGYHGIGKSTVVEHFAKENGYSFHPLFLGTMNDSGDVLGLPEFDRDANGKAISVSFINPKLLPTKPRSILFLDELSHAPKEIRGLLFQLILTGEMAGYVLPPDSGIVVAMNPDTEDYPATLDFSNKAFADRFVHIKFEPSVQEFNEYMSKKHGSDSDVLAFLSEQPKFLEESGLAPFNLDFVKPSRRSWDRLQSLVKVEEFPKDLLMEVAIGMVGTEASISLNSFLQTRVKALTGKEIINDFKANKKRLEDYFTGDVVRSDILSKVSEEVLEEVSQIYKRNELLSETQMQNIIEYYVTVPKEVMYASLRTLKTNPAILNVSQFSKEFLENKQINKVVKEANEAIQASKAAKEQNAKV